MDIKYINIYIFVIQTNKKCKLSFEDYSLCVIDDRYRFKQILSSK